MEYSLNKKYLCKKTLISQDSQIYKDNYYEISKIVDHHVMMSFDAGFEVFSKEKCRSNVRWNFPDYFYSDKEIRKQKLNKLLLHDNV